MPIYYDIQERVFHQDGEKRKKYFLIARSLGYVGRKELIEDMCTHKSLTPQEAGTALDYFFQSIPKFLKLGHTVGLEGIGHFYTAIRSEGSDSPEEATAHKKIETRVLFKPGKELRDIIQNTPIEELPHKGIDHRVPTTHQYLKDLGKKEQAFETARKCLSEGMDEALIGRLTGLSEEDIEAIKHEG